MSALADIRLVERLRATRLRAAQAKLAAARAASAEAARALKQAEAVRMAAAAARGERAIELAADPARAELRLALLEKAGATQAEAIEQAGRAGETLAERLVEEGGQRRDVIRAEARVSALAERSAALARAERGRSDEREAIEAEERTRCRA